MEKKSRPTGVTILAILEVLEGLFGILAGLGLLAAGAILGTGMFEIPAMLGALAGALVGALGLMMLVFGIVSFLLAYGLWNGRRWAWTWTLVFAVIGLIFGVLQMLGSPGSGIVQVIISGIIIYYLYRPYVKTYFGKT